MKQKCNVYPKLFLMLIHMVELDHERSGAKTLVNKVRLNRESIFLLFNIFNILSLLFTVFIHFEEYWICFCASEMSKCMLRFNLDRTTITIMFTQNTQCRLTISLTMSVNKWKIHELIKRTNETHFTYLKRTQTFCCKFKSKALLY